MKEDILEFKWTVSRGKDTYGYNVCSLYVNGKKVSSCNGGGYDMKGTALGSWIAREYQERLVNLKPEDMPKQSHYSYNEKKTIEDGRYFYGLSFHDPDYDPGKAVIGKDCSDRTFGKGSEGKTIEQAEKDSESFGLERYQAFYSASSGVPTENHRVPLIDGACGISSVENIMKVIGLKMVFVKESRNLDIYRLVDTYN
jgi:hypothetical protein